MRKKTVSESAIEGHVYKVFPNDLNARGTAFGGMIMAKCDRLSLVVAERHGGHVCVTASVDSLHFMAPAETNDTLIFKVAINRAWNSSMEIGVKVLAENSYTGKLSILCRRTQRLLRWVMTISQLLYPISMSSLRMKSVGSMKLNCGATFD